MVGLTCFERDEEWWKTCRVMEWHEGHYEKTIHSWLLLQRAFSKIIEFISGVEKCERLPQWDEDCNDKG
jgi:hypothetical protein